VTGPQDSQHPERRPPGRPGQQPADMVELGDRRLALLNDRLLRFAFLHRRLPRIAVILAAAALIIGLAAGYATGYQHARSRAAAGSRAAGPAALLPTFAGPVGPPLVQDTGLCSQQSGRTLQLGVQVFNESSAPLQLRRAAAIMPFTGLRATSLTWGSCGELPGSRQYGTQSLPPGGTGWFTMTFRVLVRCPAADPVQFRLYFDQHSRTGHVILPGFNDLGGVRYSGCRPG
jgi:hypothetical protein